MTDIFSDPHLKMIIFDFDGTLVDSNPIKLKAFDVCFSEYLSDYPEILTYCHSHHHTPRWTKFRYVYEQILKKPYTPEIERSLHQRYAAATTQAIIAAPEIPGALEFVRSQQHLETALLSSTPQEVLLEILEARGWRAYFRHIQGAPIQKSEWIKNILKQKNFKSEEVVFLGDTTEDFESAKTAGCPFVGVANPALEHQGIPYMKNFAEARMAA
ncbi:MAG: Phosphoglycolate phosphatase [Elusimicrobia bacterium]|nr:Phosphoglycolate phosphatase [Elusimicrobiota bacterium]